MKFVLCNFTVFLMIVSPGVVFSQRNIDVIDSLVAGIVDENFEVSTRIDRDTIAVFANTGNRENDNYLRFGIADLLARNSFPVYRNYRQGSSFEGEIIEISRFDIQINYSEPYSNRVFDENFSRRKITVDLHGQLFTTGAGRVVSRVKQTISHEDEIKYDNIPEYEKSAYLFTIGTREDYPGWEKYFEPAVVISSVVLMVYLFFSQRT